MRRAATLIAAMLGTAAATAAASTGSPPLAQAFTDPAAWAASGSDQVDASLRRDGDALCLAFDFHGVSGFASMRRRLPIDYPANYAFSFRVRGNAPGNALQFKLVDGGGDNVWWVNRPDYAFTREPQALRYRKRQIDFAWGPTTDNVTSFLFRHNGGLVLTAEFWRQSHLRAHPEHAGVVFTADIPTDELIGILEGLVAAL